MTAWLNSHRHGPQTGMWLPRKSTMRTATDRHSATPAHGVIVLWLVVVTISTPPSAGWDGPTR